MDSRPADRADSPFSTRFLARYPLPPARIVHAYLKRAAKPLSEEPDALVRHVRI